MGKNRSNVLLVEILIAVLFFMLSATVLVNVFATSHNLTVRAGVETRALTEAQNIAEALYASPDPMQAREELSFVESHGAWSKDCGQYTLYVSGGVQQTDNGELWQLSVSAFYKLRNPDIARQGDEQLFTLPCTRYREVRS